jgi:signal transduction histidine kinase
MNKTLDRALLARPLVFVLGGSMSAMVNPSMQRGNLAGWIAGTFGIILLLLWSLRRRPRFERMIPHVSSLVVVLGWGVVATLTGGPESPFLVAFILEIVVASVAMTPAGVLWVTANIILMLCVMTALRGFAQGWLLLLESVFVAAIGALGMTVSRRRVVGEVALRVQGEELEQRLGSLQRELEDERVISRVGEGVARLAHGLKNAVHSLRGFVRLIEPQLERGVGSKAALRGLHAAIDDLESLARMTLEESGTLPDSGARGGAARADTRVGPSCSLPEVITHARRELEAASPGVVWRVSAGPAEGSLLVPLGEETLLELLVILMRNAVEAMGGQGGACVAYAADGQSVSIAVQDEGPGFGTIDIDELLQPGFTTKVEGSGFGLFLARRIIEEHGGRLSLESAPSGGAIVRFELPGVTAAGEPVGGGV